MRTIETIIKRLTSPIGKAEIVATAKEVNQLGTKAIDHLFKELNRDTKSAMRIAWLIENTLATNSLWPKQYANQIALIYLKTENKSIRRIFGKCLTEAHLPETYFDALYDCAIKRISQVDETISAKFQAINIACKIALTYPDLFTELLALLEVEKPKNTIAFAKAYNRVLKIYKKIQQ